MHGVLIYRRSLLAALAAVVLSLLLHGVVLNVASRDVAPEPDGAEAPPPEAGGTFEDFADVAPETPEPETTEPAEPPEVTSPEPVEDMTPSTEALVATDTPQYDRAPDSGSAEVVSPDAAEPTESPVPEAAPPPEGEADSAEPVEPDAATETAEVETETNPEEAEASEETQEEASEETVQPDEPEMVIASLPDEPEIPIETGDETTEGAAVTRSLRPPKVRPSEEALAARSATQDGGSENGSERTTIRSSGLELLAQEGSISSTGASPFDASRATGNAGETNYAGRVLMQLNRAPRIATSSKGTARVQFQINADGSVGWVRVLGSSGSEGIERAAAAQVRRAAPFPPPPAGTIRRLVFVYHSN